ncbi:Protein of unknown function (DUF2637) [Actinosynnema pretiosum]|uniref:hypothetical protein n=1 Tax=Actinosynnema pretiosum TaxID=42197 RepID=UPI0020A5CE9B|nr:hypothetical protein [Actinosynnema pretiosum]MCP2093351.1 Protein of unknown function (DUF2637) [Actinosynnema pretiosum]
MSTWQESRRADKALAREQDRADRAQAFEQRRLDAAARAEQQRADREAAELLARQRSEAARERRERLVAAITGWVRANALNLMFVPVILVPALLAWTAMAAYGAQVFGPVGVLLPLFSEVAMWAFAFAVPLARRAGRPTRWLHLGVAVFALVAGALNFVHGLDAGDHAGVASGVVMALVSVSGVVVHQLITAAEGKARPTRAQRDAARLERAARQRVHRVRRAALRQAVAEIAEDGTARLVHRPGMVALRRRLGRARLVPTTVAGLPVTAEDTVAEVLMSEINEYLAALPATPRTPAAQERGEPAEQPHTGTGAQAAHTSGTAQTPTSADADKIARYTARARAAIDGGRLPAAPSRKDVQRFLRCRTEYAAAVARALGGDQDPGQEVTA